MCTPVAHNGMSLTRNYAMALACMKKETFNGIILNYNVLLHKYCFSFYITICNNSLQKKYICSSLQAIAIGSHAKQGKLNWHFNATLLSNSIAEIPSLPKEKKKVISVLKGWLQTAEWNSRKEIIATSQLL